MAKSSTAKKRQNPKTRVAVLAGAPDSVSGFVPFHNTTDAEVTVTEVLVDEADSEVSLTVPVDETLVPAGGRARIPVRLTFPPQTAPGPYPLTITVSGEGIPTVGYVAEARLVGLSPDAVIVDSVPKTTSVKHVVVSNQGNVTVFVADFGKVPLYREDTALGTLLPIARDSALDVPSDIDPLPEAAAMIGVAIEGGRVAIPPGETQAVELIVTIPPDLLQTTRYLAALPVSVRTLLLVVVPAGGEGTDTGRKRPS